MANEKSPPNIPNASDFTKLKLPELKPEEIADAKRKLEAFKSMQGAFKELGVDVSEVMPHVDWALKAIETTTKVLGGK